MNNFPEEIRLFERKLWRRAIDTPTLTAIMLGAQRSTVSSASFYASYKKCLNYTWCLLFICCFSLISFHKRKHGSALHHREQNVSVMSVGPGLTSLTCVAECVVFVQFQAGLHATHPLRENRVVTCRQTEMVNHRSFFACERLKHTMH
jgi:hypothetical protein